MVPCNEEKVTNRQYPVVSKIFDEGLWIVSVLDSIGS